MNGCSQTRRNLTIAIKRIMSQEIDQRKWKIILLDDLDRGGGVDLGDNQSIALRPLKQMSELEREKRHVRGQ